MANIFLTVLFMCMGICLHVCLHHLHICCPRRPEERIGSCRTEVIDGCGPPSECWEPNTSLLEEQLMFSTTEPSK